MSGLRPQPAHEAGPRCHLVALLPAAEDRPTRAGVRRPERDGVLDEEVARKPGMVPLDLRKRVADDEAAHRVPDEVNTLSAPGIVAPDRPSEVVPEVADARVGVVRPPAVAVVPRVLSVMSQPVRAVPIAAVVGDGHERALLAEVAEPLPHRPPVGAAVVARRVVQVEAVDEEDRLLAVVRTTRVGGFRDRAYDDKSEQESDHAELHAASLIPAPVAIRKPSVCVL